MDEKRRIDSKDVLFQAGLTIIVFISAIILLGILPTPTQSIIVNPSELGSGWTGTEYLNDNHGSNGRVSYANYDYTYYNGSYLFIWSMISLFDSTASCQSHFNVTLGLLIKEIFAPCPIGDLGVHGLYGLNYLNYSWYVFTRGPVYCEISVNIHSTDSKGNNDILLKVIQLQLEKIDREIGL